MDWSSLGPDLIKLGAPLIGEAVGGPLGAAAGKIVAQAFGVADPSPPAVADAIARADPSAAAEAARSAEAAWAASVAEIGRAQVSEIGATMRLEAASGDRVQRWWRPIYALELSLIECPGFALLLGHALWTGEAALVNGFANLSALIMTYMGARFGVLGVYMSGRSREKQASVTGELAPSLLAELAKLLAKKK